MANNIRPKTINDFLGQTSIVEQVKIASASAMERDQCFPHMIMGGPPGLGKTTLAQIVANEMGGVLISRIASAISKPEDLVDLFTQIEQPNTIIFIDEMEQLKRKISELLHTAMEDGKFTAKLEDGRVINVDLPEFTLMGATNYLGELARPFLDRFKIQVNFEPYSHDEINQIVVGAVQKLRLRATKDAAREIALRSRGVPRISIRFLENARDVSLAYKDEFNSVITSACVQKMFDVHEVDDMGLTDLDRRILEFLAKYEKPIGIKALAQGVNEDISTVELAEGYLVRIGMVLRTARGREITEYGTEHINQYANK